MSVNGRSQQHGKFAEMIIEVLYIMVQSASPFLTEESLMLLLSQAPVQDFDTLPLS